LTDWNRLLQEIREAAGEAEGRDGKLAAVCRVLRRVPHYDWIGFYIAEPGSRELVLGPYAGEPTQHVRIPYGKGLCGRTAETLETLMVQDVEKETNYLSCSSRVRSEIVVPVFKEGGFVAELDIDSHSPAPFTDEDRRFLEEVGALAGALF
jgi:L-methionine (R)-S-oxide reductase